MAGEDRWFRLEPRSSASRVQGDCQLVLKLITTQVRAHRCQSISPPQPCLVHPYPCHLALTLPCTLPLDPSCPASGPVTPTAPALPLQKWPSRAGDCGLSCRGTLL